MSSLNDAVRSGAGLGLGCARPRSATRFGRLRAIKGLRIFKSIKRLVVSTPHNKNNKLHSTHHAPQHLKLTFALSVSVAAIRRQACVYFQSFPAAPPR